MAATILITGASSGFGYHTALKCAERGFNVIATMRDTERSDVFQATDEKVKMNIQVWQLDVTDSLSIKNFRDKLSGVDRIDVLVNNAGFAVGGFMEQVSLEAYRRQFETNVFGVIAVTQAILPIMRRQKSGKILNVSSISGLMGFPGLSPYVSSKHALEGLSESLRLEVKPFGIDVALIEPGSYQTNIWSSGMELPKAIYDPSSPYANYVKGLWKALNREVHGDPAHVALFMNKLIGQPKIKKMRHPIGAGVRMNLFLKRILPWAWLEKIVLKKLLN